MPNEGNADNVELVTVEPERPELGPVAAAEGSEAAAEYSYR